jgi:hypothetical protein
LSDPRRLRWWRCLQQSCDYCGCHLCPYFLNITQQVLMTHITFTVVSS